MKKKIRVGSFFSLACGCKDFNNIIHTPSNSTNNTTTTTSTWSTSLSSQLHPKRPNLQEQEEEEDEQVSTTSSTPSVGSLLRQLSVLEETILSLDQKGCKPSQSIHRTRSLRADSHRQEELWSRDYVKSRSEGIGAVGRSVAVVKETDDPVGDFRKSMVAMIAEEQIVGEDELRRLLGRFLALNEPENHHLVLRAFMAALRQIFGGCGDCEAENGRSDLGN